MPAHHEAGMWASVQVSPRDGSAVVDVSGVCGLEGRGGEARRSRPLVRALCALLPT